MFSVLILLMMVVLAYSACVAPVFAEASAPQPSPPTPGMLDSMKQRAKGVMDAMPSMPTVAMPSMPDFSLPDMSQASSGLMKEFDTFIKQIGDSLPLLEEMGYEVTSFRVQWALPPKAKLRLKSRNGSDPERIKAIVAKAANGGVLMSALVSSAASAKNIQSNMKLGAAVIDVDFAMPPKVRMSFLNRKSEFVERDIEDLDTACGKAFEGN